MLISVVIPHYNQSSSLETGLEALHSQEGVRSDIEFLVVDNGSNEPPESICAAWPDVRLLFESTPGPGPARNRGVASANGHVMAFIDADCRAHSRWLATIEELFRDESIDIVGGDVQVSYERPRQPRFVEPYEAIYSYRNEEHVAEGFSGTGNLAVRRRVLEAVGPFAGIDVAEDRDWGLRSAAAGYRIHFAPEMIVYHPARSDFAELARKWDRHIRHDYESMAQGRFGRWRWVARAVAVTASPLIEVPTVVASPRVAGPRERLLAFVCLVRVRVYRGRAMLRITFSGGATSARDSWRRS